MAKATAEFRESVESDGIVVAPGAYDAASAKLVERAGAEVVYMSGSSVSTSVHGYPDVGVTTLTEMTDRARQMANAVDVPVFADADTGYGNPINVRRTVEEFEAAGVAGVHLEDQTFPKQCGHFEGKDVVATDEMTAKLRAAADAREDDEFVLIARTDARAVEGFEAAVERSRSYLEAGADVIFFEAPESVAELEEAAERIDAPMLANMTEGGKTPMLSADELDALGYDIALFPATGFKAVLNTLQDVYAEIVETGSQQAVMDELVTWEGRNEITGLDRIRDLEDRYATDGDR
ncbi:isocitrate lyase/phosphoenolpyruvate mutase family protein (plasmid) [Halorussus limi]|uniref:Isocitrate lyase/phosphoenolpyruvate mutase family protein n=1 Tax=Halorussus limi TaxID=2938695 RepID=A0A8U0I0C6_9EURY|nr:isocitrate lyase/phosphoenolpyruvate mutase family protein [Halorussus limi]UPV76730.1 isocitrate lyase/phosphoenolpyruvate mutase family protein [Halorussus limi]